MCGLAGFAGAGDEADLTRMIISLAHRGPDDFGVYSEMSERVYLGHRRLSIVDIHGGHQPMAHPDGTIQVVFNGEIYNHVQLRIELTARGHNFISDHSDTEVLIHGFKEWGADLPGKLNGMFAFAIYDALKGILFLARDRFGEKPLYFSAHSKGFVFASELKSILEHSFVSKDISKQEMKKFFAYGFIPAPGTIISSVKKLMPGHHLTYDVRRNAKVVEPYWTFKLRPIDKRTSNESLLKAELRRLVDQAVERRLMSDVPVGVFLSGGVDSSIILSSVIQAKDATAVDTFSIGFKEKSFDESTYARAVAKHFGTNHHEKIIDSNDARDILDYVLDKLDEPLGDPSLLPTYLLAAFSQKNVKVALGGDGADELFAGYDPFKALALAKLYACAVPKAIHSGLLKVAYEVSPSDKNMSLDFRIKRTLKGLSYPKNLWNPVWLGPLDPANLGCLFGEPLQVEETYAEAFRDWNNSPEYSLTEHTLSFYTNLYLMNNILTKVDRATMLASLESRAPFLDNDLVSFVEVLPTDYKLKGFKTKYLLKAAFKDRLPEIVLTRPKKGFGIPLSAWLRTWDDSSFLENLPFIDRRWLESKWVEHKTKKADHRQLLWCAISLSRFIKSIEGHQKIDEPCPSL